MFNENTTDHEDMYLMALIRILLNLSICLKKISRVMCKLNKVPRNNFSPIVKDNQQQTPRSYNFQCGARDSERKKPSYLNKSN